MSNGFGLGGDEYSTLPDLEFATLPRTYSDQEITVINDASQLNFLTDGASIDGGYSSVSEEEDPVDVWSNPHPRQVKIQPKTMSLSPQNQNGHSGSFSSMPAPSSVSSYQDPAQNLTFGAPAMGLNTTLQSYGSMGSMQAPNMQASSPSKRMKRRLSNPSHMAQSAVLSQQGGHQQGLYQQGTSQGMSQGMLRTSSVPEMRSAPLPYNVMASYGQGSQAPSTSALPPLKEKQPKSGGRAAARALKKSAKASSNDEKTNRRHRHNESERVRMRTIASKIAEMKKLMEDTGIVVPKEKAKILTGAVEYMRHLKKVAQQKNMQLLRLQETSAFNATPLPCCIMDAACNYLDCNPHFTRYFGPPHKAFPSAILLVPDWIYGRSVPQKVGLWLDLVQNLRTEHTRLHGMQLEDQCLQHSGKTVNFRILATLINYNPASTVKDTKILLTFFPMPPQAGLITQLVAIKSYDDMHQQTAVHAEIHGNQMVASSGASAAQSNRTFGK